ncbi:hypothetical protein ABZ667_26050 [Streptomyces lavendulae]|uniref:hypothetical protein n=1 Tax=Streptomyces lavendulae TaxID=1914 RepID=UPI0034098885
MDHIIDLDRAVCETWRDDALLWPQRLETDRALVADPDSLGVRILGTGRRTWAPVLRCAL